MLSERALERRIKRYLRKELQNWFVVGTPGFEPELESEVRALPDVQDVEVVTGGINFRGPLDTVYHANLHLRTAHRVLLRVRTFLAQTYPMMYDHARKVPWELYVGFAPSFTFRVHASTSRLRHKNKIARTLADAAAQRLATLGLPGSYEKTASIEFHVRLFEDRCTLSLNTSGEHLHKRGYRTYVSKAPMRETLAASILLASDAVRFDTYFDPFCGSGTLLIEAAMIRAGIAPGGRREFAFYRFPYFQPSKWIRIREEARKLENRQVPIECIGNDLDTKSLYAFQMNAQVNGMSKYMKMLNMNVASLNLNNVLSGRKYALIASNLPYGRRILPQESNRIIEVLLTSVIQLDMPVDIAVATTNIASFNRSEIQIISKRKFNNGGISVYYIHACYTP